MDARSYVSDLIYWQFTVECQDNGHITTGSCVPSSTCTRRQGPPMLMRKFSVAESLAVRLMFLRREQIPDPLSHACLTLTSESVHRCLPRELRQPAPTCVCLPSLSHACLLCPSLLVSLCLLMRSRLPGPARFHYNRSRHEKWNGHGVQRERSHAAILSPRRPSESFVHSWERIFEDKFVCTHQNC